MVSRKEIESTGFHEAEIKSIEMRGSHISLRLDNIVVEIDNDDCYSVDLDFDGITTLICDEKNVDNLQMEGDGSSIIQFEYSDHFAVLVVDWRHYRARRNVTRSYSFNFESLNFRFEKQDCKIN